MGLSSRSRNRLFVNYTKNTNAATRFPYPVATTPRNCFFFHITIGKLANKRSNSSVGGGHTGTGGLLSHFLMVLVGRCSLHLDRVSKNGLRGTVPERTRTIYTIPVTSGRGMQITLGVFLTRMRGRFTIARPGLAVRLRSRAPYTRMVRGRTVAHFLRSLCTIRRKICTVDRSVRNLIRASSGLTSIGVHSNGVIMIADRHDSVLSSHGSVSRVMHSTFRLNKTAYIANSNCPK